MQWVIDWILFEFGREKEEEEGNQETVCCQKNDDNDWYKIEINRNYITQKKSRWEKI